MWCTCVVRVYVCVCDSGMVDVYVFVRLAILGLQPELLEMRLLRPETEPEPQYQNQTAE